VFVLGYVENPRAEKWEMPGIINKQRAQRLIASFSSPEQVSAALGELRAALEGLLSIYRHRIRRRELNRMVNIWNPYQCMVTFNLSRSASYFESGIWARHGLSRFQSGSVGLRALGAGARSGAHHRHCLDAACRRQRVPPIPTLTKRGNNDVGSGFNDDPLWLILGVAAYLRGRGTTAFWTSKCVR